MKFHCMKLTKPIKIILIDDHILLRDALADLIDSFVQFSVVAKAANGEELIELIESGVRADILLMDLSMPKMDGYETAKWVAEKQPQIKTVILTMYDTEMALLRLLHLGVSGFLRKDIHPAELNEALVKVAAGEYYYSISIIGKIASHYREHPVSMQPFEKQLLTEQDIWFIKLSCTGISYKEIAIQMRLSTKYLDNYRIKIFEKLQVNNRVELTIYAIKNGIITI